MSHALVQEIVVKFMEMLILVKLYHWDTFSYATHKATDDLYTKLNANMDEFVEGLLGKHGNRVHLPRSSHIKLKDIHSPEAFKREIESFKAYLTRLDDVLRQPGNGDLISIRDTLLGNLNLFLYLLSFK